MMGGAELKEIKEKQDEPYSEKEKEELHRKIKTSFAQTGDEMKSSIEEIKTKRWGEIKDPKIRNAIINSDTE
jgi:hypothetical protein